MSPPHRPGWRTGVRRPAAESDGLHKATGGRVARELRHPRNASRARAAASFSGLSNTGSPRAEWPGPAANQCSISRDNSRQSNNTSASSQQTGPRRPGSRATARIRAEPVLLCQSTLVQSALVLKYAGPADRRTADRGRSPDRPRWIPSAPRWAAELAIIAQPAAIAGIERQAYGSKDHRRIYLRQQQHGQRIAPLGYDPAAFSTETL